MCINQSVGHLGRNRAADVKMIQTMLNLNRYRYKSEVPAALKVDGLIGRKTIEAIRTFQLEILNLPFANALVVNGDPNLRALRSGLLKSYELVKQLDKQKLLAFMPHALETDIDKYSGHLKNIMPYYEINKPLRVAHFLAQLAHESGSFRYTEELASGLRYEGRVDLGNVIEGDGIRFKGRGLIQLTGRSNYEQYSDATGIDYVKNPKLLASDPKASADVACWFWNSRNLNPLADRDDVRAVTQRINGGTNGIGERTAILDRAKCLMGL